MRHVNKSPSQAPTIDRAADLFIHTYITHSPTKTREVPVGRVTRRPAGLLLICPGNIELSCPSKLKSNRIR